MIILFCQIHLGNRVVFSTSLVVERTLVEIAIYKNYGGRSRR